jgi:ABC-type transport system involved in cytochrome bd biosynthesis fused ATPase/permease subunit
LVAPACSRDEAREMLRELGMNRVESALDAPAGSFSRGEARRIATARALLRRPRLLVLDEPDAWLDARGRGKLLDAVLSRSRHCSLLVVSHRLDVLARFEQILVLSAEHRLEALGSLSEVAVTSPAFREIRDGASPGG